MMSISLIEGRQTQKEKGSNKLKTNKCKSYSGSFSLQSYILHVPLRQRLLMHAPELTAVKKSCDNPARVFLHACRLNFFFCSAGW